MKTASRLVILEIMNCFAVHAIDENRANWNIPLNASLLQPIKKSCIGDRLLKSRFYISSQDDIFASLRDHILVSSGWINFFMKVLPYFHAKRVFLETDSFLSKKRANRRMGIAASLGNIDLWNKFASVGNWNAREKDGDTYLHIAVKNRRIDFVRYLLERGFNPNVVNGDQLAPIHYAAMYNCVDILDLLVKKYAMLEMKYRGKPPLLLAIEGMNVGAAIHLIHYGAEIRFCEGITALHAAARWNVPEVVQFLLDNGYFADNFGQKYCVDIEDANGKTPLYYAVEGNSFDVVKLLLAYGADINYLNHDIADIELRKKAEQKKFNFESLVTPFEYTILYHHISMMRVLLVLGKPVFNKDSSPVVINYLISNASLPGKGNLLKNLLMIQPYFNLTLDSLIHDAFISNDADAFEEIVHYRYVLSSRRVCMNLALDAIPFDAYNIFSRVRSFMKLFGGGTSKEEWNEFLICAAKNCSCNILGDILFKKRHKIDFNRFQEEVPAFLVMKSSRFNDVVSLDFRSDLVKRCILFGDNTISRKKGIYALAILDNGRVALDVEDELHNSLLWYALGSTDTELMYFLLNHGVDENKKMEHECTLLHRAIYEKNEEKFSNLLKIPTLDINAQDNQGDTPLMCAIRWGNLKVINTLLWRGAKLDIQNRAGATAEDIAVLGGNRNIINAIETQKLEDEAFMPRDMAVPLLQRSFHQHPFEPGGFNSSLFKKYN